jgi:hypothetical protein
MAAPPLEASKDCYMKKKLLVLLIAVIPTLMPNLASAIAIDIEGEIDSRCSRGTDCFFGD